MSAISLPYKLDKSCATVVFLRNAAVITPAFYLAKKKQNIHTDEGKKLPASSLWNGYGGKWKKGDETIFHTAKRELFEETNGVEILIKDLVLGARIEFFWPGNTSKKRDMEVFFFTTHKYSKYPEETEAMGPPELFTTYDAPYGDMMPGDDIIISNIFAGKKVEGQMFFSLGEKGRRLSRKELRISAPVLR